MGTFKETGPPEGPDMFAQRSLNWEYYAELEGYQPIDLPRDFEALVREAFPNGEVAHERIERCHMGYNRLNFLKPRSGAASKYLEAERKKLSATLAHQRRARLRLVVSNIMIFFAGAGVSAVIGKVMERLIT